MPCIPNFTPDSGFVAVCATHHDHTKEGSDRILSRQVDQGCSPLASAARPGTNGCAPGQVAARAGACAPVCRVRVLAPCTCVVDRIRRGGRACTHISRYVCKLSGWASHPKPYGHAKPQYWLKFVQYIAFSKGIGRLNAIVVYLSIGQLRTRPTLTTSLQTGFCACYSSFLIHCNC